MIVIERTTLNNIARMICGTMACETLNVEEITLVQTYQRKPLSKIRTGYRQHSTRNFMFTISVITNTNVPSMSLSQRGRGQSGSNVSAKVAVQDSNQI